MKGNNKKSSSGVMLTQSQWDRCDRLANEKGYHGIDKKQRKEIQAMKQELMIVGM